MGDSGRVADLPAVEKAFGPGGALLSLKDLAYEQVSVVQMMLRGKSDPTSVLVETYGVSLRDAAIVAGAIEQDAGPGRRRRSSNRGDRSASKAGATSTATGVGGVSASGGIDGSAWSREAQEYMARYKARRALFIAKAMYVVYPVMVALAIVAGFSATAECKDKGSASGWTDEEIASCNGYDLVAYLSWLWLIPLAHTHFRLKKKEYLKLAGTTFCWWFLMALIYLFSATTAFSESPTLTGFIFLVLLVWLTTVAGLNAKQYHLSQLDDSTWSISTFKSITNHYGNYATTSTTSVTNWATLRRLADGTFELTKNTKSSV